MLQVKRVAHVDGHGAQVRHDVKGAFAGRVARPLASVADPQLVARLMVRIISQVPAVPADQIENRPRGLGLVGQSVGWGCHTGLVEISPVGGGKSAEYERSRRVDAAGCQHSASHGRTD